MTIEYRKIYGSSNMVVAGLCGNCGDRLRQILHSPSFGHLTNEECDQPFADRVWFEDRGIAAHKGETKADHLTIEEKRTLDMIQFGKTCSKCGFEIRTELDFAAHFVIKDRRYLNIRPYRPQRATVYPQSAGELVTTKVHPEVWATAMKLCDGDPTRIVVRSAEEVVIVNRSKRHGSW